MSKDLMYIDYANGMSPVANSNTIRLYKYDQNNNKSFFICSAPYDGTQTFTASNDYSNSSTGLLLSMMEQAAKGIKHGTQLFGQGMSILSSASDIINNVLDKLGDRAAKVKDVFNNIDATTKASAQSALADGQTDTIMPWQDVVIYKRTDLQIPIPSMNFTLLSSEKLSDYLLNISGNASENDRQSGKILLDSNKNIIKGTITDAFMQKSDNGAVGNIVKSENMGYDLYGNPSKAQKDIKQTPVRYMIHNILLKNIAGTVQCNSKDMFTGLTFGSPTPGLNSTKIVSQVFDATGNAKLLNDTFKNTFWMAIGDFNSPMIIRNLVPKSISIKPSNILTTTDDFLSATVEIQFDHAKRIFSKEFSESITPVSANEKGAR